MCCVGHAEGDTFVAPVHSEKLLARYGSDDKRLIRFKGDHNSIRPAVFYTEVLMYFHRSLRCEDVLIPDEQNPGQFELHSDDAARYVSKFHGSIQCSVSCKKLTCT